MTLLDEVKNYLDITWTDSQADLKLNGIIESGKQYFNGKAGAELDYNAEGIPKTLLMEFCKHARNGNLNEFFLNYIPFIEDLRIKNGGAYGKDTTV